MTVSESTVTVTAAAAAVLSHGHVVAGPLYNVPSAPEPRALRLLAYCNLPMNELFAGYYSQHYCHWEDSSSCAAVGDSESDTLAISQSGSSVSDCHANGVASGAI